MHPLIRSAVRTILPARVFERLHAERSRRHQIGYLTRLGIVDATKRYIERFGTVVRHGPFAGLVYPLDAALNRVSIPKLLGAYEKELHPVLDACSRRSYDCVVDIGSAEGYYAVGLARLLGVPVFAYDPERFERSFCLAMAQLNGVKSLVHIKDLFSVADIDRFSDRRCLVVCDCEGFENALFTEQTVPATSRWDVLIEMHGNAASVLPTLRWAQKPIIIDPAPRQVIEYSELDLVQSDAPLLCEFRTSDNKWLWCDGSGSGSGDVRLSGPA